MKTNSDANVCSYIVKEAPSSENSITVISSFKELLKATNIPPSDPVFLSDLLNLDMSVKGKISLISTSAVSHVSPKKQYLGDDIESDSVN